MDPITLTVLLVVLGAAVLGSIVYLNRPRPRTDPLASYTESLSHLIDGNTDLALQKLRETVLQDSSNVDAYIRIGDLLRERKQYDRAIKIHRDLTVRHDLSSRQRLAIQDSLARDYFEAGRYDRALAVTNQILDSDSSNHRARSLKLKVLEHLNEWEKAFQVCREIMRRDNGCDESRLPLYKVYSGLHVKQKGKESEARQKFREAIKIDGACAPAYLYLGDSYLEEGRSEKAIEVLSEFAQQNPELSHLAFGRMKQALFDVQQFGTVEIFLNELLSQNPKMHEIRFALAEIYDKKGQIDRAISLCNEVLLDDPESMYARQYLVKLHSRKGDEHEAVQYALELVDESWTQKAVYTCSECGNESDEPLWRCPRCQAWSSYDIG